LQDRVEVRVSESRHVRGDCDVQPHFIDIATGQFIMFGYVKVQK